MKVTPNNSTTSMTNRVSALKRLSKPTAINKNHIRHRLSAATITDARELLTSRNKPIFDARQLLTRQSSNIRNDIVETEEDEEMIVTNRFQPSRFTSETPDLLSETRKKTFAITRKKNNSNSTEPISFTKTITNASLRREDDDRHSNTQSSLSNEKVVISVFNDHYRKKSRSPSPPPIIRRLNNASIQTAHSSRSPIRMDSHRRHMNEQDDIYEPPIKRPSSRRTTTGNEQGTLSRDSVKRTSTGAPVSTRVSSNTSSKATSSSDSGTVLVTNLQSSVTEDDVIELFGEVGRINDITTLSRGCVQLIYSKQEHAEKAVKEYHNRLLDGQLMYVSLQQPADYSTKSSKNSSSISTKSTNIKGKGTSMSSSSKNESRTSNSSKILIDPTFIRQALFNPSNNTTNPVQFQVKL